MTEIKNGKGNCLCGSIQVTVGKVKKNVGACHCSMCRKWGGGPLLAVDCGTEVSFEGDKNITVYDSSEWAERGFCSKCGSHLFYRLKEANQYIMSVGLFGDEEQFILDHQIFIDEKPHFYSFAEETLNMTGAEVFAKYAPKSD